MPRRLAITFLALGILIALPKAGRSQTISLTSSLNPADWGQSVVFTAHVTPGAPATSCSGDIIFSGGVFGGNGIVPLSGDSAYDSAYFLTIGANTVTATYGGSDYQGCTKEVSARLTETINSPPTIYPAYQVTSIVYAPPGNQSSNGFTTSTTDGSTTSVGSSFAAESTITFNAGWDFFSSSQSFGTTLTEGNTEAFTETFTDATGISNKSNPSNPNAVNHSQDLFVIWLNPSIRLVITGSSSATYGVGTQLEANGQPEPVDSVQVTAEVMQNNTVPANILQLQYDVETGVSDLPGLASICANQSQYVNNCLKGSPCGCVASDFAPILALDPLLSYSTNQNPMGADTSGVAACSLGTITPADKCRYVQVPTAPGSTIQVTALLQGPDCAGCNQTPNTFTQTDQAQETQTFSESIAETVASSVKVSLPSNGPSLESQTKWTWTNSESVGEINGYANSMSITLLSSTVDCYMQIPVFEDTMFHTFVMYQPSSEGNSCP